MGPSNNGDPPVGARSALTALSGTSTFGDKTKGLQHCKIICCEEDKAGVADLTLRLGYELLRDDKGKGMLHVYLLAVAPTGHEPCGDHMFQPRIGNKRWQIGAGMFGRVEVWNDADWTVQLFGDFEVSHLFKHRECRCFDFRDLGCGSRYLLLKEYMAPVNSMTVSYNNRLVNAVDVFATSIKSDFDWQLEGLFGAQLNHDHWSATLAYNIWARAEETFDCKSACLCNCSNSLDRKEYGVKGKANARSTNNYAPDSTIKKAGSEVDLNLQPSQLINENNLFNKLDFCSGAAPRAVSHSIVGNVRHAWPDRDHPLVLSFGGKVEFGRNNTALDTWGLWLNAGVSFD